MQYSELEYAILAKVTRAEHDSDVLFSILVFCFLNRPLKNPAVSMHMV